MTALAVLTLVGEGRLALGDTLGRFIAGVPEDKRTITIAQLLSHTAGLKREAVRDSVVRDEAVREILQVPLRQAPGRGFSYSNAGYELLAGIVEHVAGEPFDRFVEQHVFGPAAMKSSGFLDEPLAAGALLARGYRNGVQNGLAADPHPGWRGTGSGSAYSTAEDLFRWHRALLAGRIVSAAARLEMMVPRVATDDGTSYGYGWFVAWPGSDSTLVFHGGDDAGFHSELRWFPREDLVTVILTNEDVFDIDGGAVAKRQIARGLRRILLGRPDDPLPAAVPIDARELRALIGRYVLPGGDRLELVARPQGAWVEASGSNAAAALLPPAESLEVTQRVLDARARTLLNAIASGDTSSLGHDLDRADYAFGGPFIASEIASQRERQGALRDVEVLGSASVPWDPSAWRTYLVLHFERGDEDLYLGREAGALNDCTAGAGFRHPVELPIARLEADRLVAYDRLRRHAVPIVLERDSNQAIVALRIGATDSMRATRVR
jgi:CubicO group peptidase (beta-lactamase class C family)